MTRVSIPVGIARGSDVELARRILLQIASGFDRVTATAGLGMIGSLAWRLRMRRRHDSYRVQRIAPILSSIMPRIAVVLILCLSADRVIAAADQPLVVDLWPGKAPDDAGITGEEKFIQLMVNGKAYEVAGKPTKWLTNVTKPALLVYPAPKDRNTRLAMLTAGPAIATGLPRGRSG